MLSQYKYSNHLDDEEYRQKQKRTPINLLQARSIIKNAMNDGKHPIINNYPLPFHVRTKKVWRNKASRIPNLDSASIARLIQHFGCKCALMMQLPDT
eukprot:IDg2524t1